jgi:hypothetical protein
MATIRIQSVATGYKGKAANLLGALDTDTGLLVVAREMPPGQVFEGATVVTNDPRSGDRDSLFTEEKLQDAIRLFFRAKANGTIEIMSALTKHDPDHFIEVQGIEERGSRYRLNPDFTNGNAAVLAMLESAHRAYLAQEVTDFSDELAEFFVTI